MGFFYNPDLLKKGGFDHPPTTWDEAQQMAVALKEQKLADFPFDFDLSKASNSSLMWLFWTMAFGDGGHIFDANNAPLWPDKDPTYLKIVTFLTDAVQKYKTLDPSRIQPSSAAIGPLDAGLAAFGIGASYGLPREQDTQYTKIPGVNKMTYAPSFHQVENLPLGTVTWTRMYGISSYTQDLETTWKAEYFLGGKDKNGDYWNSKNWLEHDFKFSGFKSFRESQFAQDIAKKWGDPTVTTKLAAAAKAREALKEPWWSDWDVFNQGELQSAMLAKETPEVAAKNSADEVRRLQAKFKS
jgi:multiple sugar transport system substrate-binding protein